MNLKHLSAAIGIAMGCSLGQFAVAATVTESSETTVQKSTSVEPPPPAARVIEEHTTTKTKRGILGRRKSETTTSTRSVDAVPDRSNATEYRSSTTTTESHRDY